MADRENAEKPSGKTVRLSDHVASIALPLGIIALGIALSAGSDQVQAFVDLCRAALP